MDKFEIFKKSTNNHEPEISYEEIKKISNATNLAKDLIKKMKNNPLIYPKINNK